MIIVSIIQSDVSALVTLEVLAIVFGLTSPITAAHADGGVGGGGRGGGGTAGATGVASFSSCAVSLVCFVSTAAAAAAASLSLADDDASAVVTAGCVSALTVGVCPSGCCGAVAAAGFFSAGGSSNRNTFSVSSSTAQ